MRISLSFRIYITKINHHAPTINRVLICWGRFRHGEGCTTPLGGDARLQPAEYSQISLDDVATNFVLFAMTFLWSLLFWFCSLLQLDERLSVKATHRRVVNKVTRQSGVLPLDENLFPLVIAKLTFNLLNSHHRRAYFCQIS